MTTNSTLVLLHKTISFNHQVIHSLDLDRQTALKLSKKLLELQCKLDILKRDRLEDYLQPHDFTTLGDCQKLLSKANSKLIKKTDPHILAEPQLQKRVLHIWEQTQLGSIDTSNSFMEHFPLTNKRNPLVLHAFRDTIRLKILSEIKQAIQLDDKEKVSSLIETLPKKDRENLEPSSNSLEHLTNAIDILSGKIPNEKLTLKRPYIHCRLNFSELELVEKLMHYAPGKFSLELSYRLSKFNPPVPISTFNIPFFVQQNIAHPFMQGLGHDVYASLIANFAKQLENNDWVAASADYLKCIEFLLKNDTIKDYLSAKKFDQTVIDSLKDIAKHHQELAKILSTSTNAPPQFYEEDHVCVQSICHDWNALSKEQLNLYSLAYEALWHSVEEISLSSNFLSREDTRINTKNYSPTEIRDLEAKVNDRRQDTVNEEIEALYKDKFHAKNPFIKCFAAAKTAKSYFLGNCGHLARSTFVELLKRLDPIVNVSLLSIKKLSDNGLDGDHVFVLINLDPKADPLNPASWKNAIVCDPWARRIYSSELIPELLYDYYGTNDFGKPLLRKFNPSLQKLDVEAEKVCSVANFKAATQGRYPDYETYLDKFHTAETLPEKEKIARELLDIVAKHNSIVYIFKMLKAQLNFFLTKKL